MIIGSYRHPITLASLKCLYRTSEKNEKYAPCPLY
jgi:hypothetical protein